MQDFIKKLSDSSIFIEKNDPVHKYLEVAQQIIIFNNYDKKPYLNTTENEQYMRGLINSSMKKAFVVLGGGDPAFQLLAHDVLDIDAVEINEMQNLIFSLKKAAFRTLNNSEYESFLIDRSGVKFLSKDIFDYAKAGFTKEEMLEKKFWDLFLSKADPEEIKQYFFKGGVECCDIDISRKSLLFTKKKNLYYKIRENLEKAKISVKNVDALKCLKENSDKEYDYIDITNILLFIYQQKSREEFEEYIKGLRYIYENNLNNRGIFVLDYMFGIGNNQLVKEYVETNIDKKIAVEIYKEIYRYLSEWFKVDMLNVDAVPKVIILNGFSDTVLYTKK